MVSPARQFNATADEERVLEVVRELVGEMGNASAVRSASPASHLDRELGLGSLERVELLLRLEKTFGTRLDEEVLAGAETVQDLITALSAPRMARLAPQECVRKPSVRAAEISFPGRAEGVPTAETFQEVLRHRGRADASRTHLIFYEDEEGRPFSHIRRVACRGRARGGRSREARHRARRHCRADAADVARFFSRVRGHAARRGNSLCRFIRRFAPTGLRNTPNGNRRSWRTRARACW